MASYDYCVRTDLPSPVLIRFGDSGAEKFRSNGTWERAPHLDSIAYGHGLFMSYDNITEEEAAKYMNKIRGLKH